VSNNGAGFDNFAFRCIVHYACFVYRNFVTLHFHDVVTHREGRYEIIPLPVTPRARALVRGVHSCPLHQIFPTDQETEGTLKRRVLLTF